MPPARFEPTISVGERPKIYALYRAATGTGKEKTYFCQKWDIKLLLREFHERVATTETAIMDCKHSWMGATKSFIITPHFTEVMNDLWNMITPWILWHCITYCHSNTQLTCVTAHYSTVIYCAGNDFSIRFITFPLSFPCTPSYRVTLWLTALNNQHTGVQKLTETHFRQTRISSPRWLWCQYRHFNIQQFYVLPTQLYLCVLCGSENSDYFPVQR